MYRKKERRIFLKTAENSPDFFGKTDFIRSFTKIAQSKSTAAIPRRERSEPSAHAPLTVPAEQNSGVSKGLRSDKKTAFGTA